MSGRIIAAGGVTRWAHTLNGCLIFGMSTTYSELAERIMSGQTLSRDEIHELIVTSDGQDFALIEAASAIRRHEFRNMIAVHTDDEELAAALGTRSIAIDGYETLDLSTDIDSEVLADKLAELGEGNTTGITVKLPANAVPMTLMRVLAITRMAAPDKVLHLPDGYEEALRSLSSLAMHIVSAITISDDIERWPIINETLKALKHGGIVIAGAGGQDALAGYLRYLSELGVDLMGYREARGSACGSVDGGGCCGGHDHAESSTESSAGGCGCGSEGCGSSAQASESVAEPPPAAVSASHGCGCGSGGCGA